MNNDSRSESNLSDMGDRSGSPCGSSGDLSPLGSSLNLAAYSDFGNTDSVEELRDQINTLKKHAQRTNAAMNALKYKQVGISLKF